MVHIFASRLKILSALKNNSLCVSEIINETKLEQSLVSHQLKELKKGLLVESVKTGKWVYYSLTAKGREVLNFNRPASTWELVQEDSRAKLLSLLKFGPKNVSQLISQTGFEQSLVSHHLKDLRDGHQVAAQKQGRWVFYSLYET